MYADLEVVTKKKRSEAPEVDQHTVTYSTLDMAATSRTKASTMPTPSKGESAEQGEGRKRGSLDSRSRLNFTLYVAKTRTGTDCMSVASNINFFS